MNTEQELKRLWLAVIFLAVMVVGLAAALLGLHWQVYRLASAGAEFARIIAGT